MKQFKSKNKRKILAFILCIALIAVSAAILYSCGDDKSEDDNQNILGEGALSFTLNITDGQGNIKSYIIKTDKTTLGDALVEVGLTDDSLFIATLDGITADWDTDESWWKIAVNGEDAAAGAFDIDLESEAVYSFVYTIGFDM
ncbi:MAG: hypothetical protein FWH10_08610, partial [Oscillospiraceae bacterium]|nr:hypothetical protein [Oscillospiraceae bacterium]